MNAIARDARGGEAAAPDGTPVGPGPTVGLGPAVGLGAPVDLRKLRLSYGGGVPAVDDVSLSVAAGEFVSLLGPSGSGKTTTLKMVAGFEAPDSGDILVAGRSVIGVAPSRRNIGMVFQNYALFPHMSVHDNVAFPLKMRRRPRDEIRRAVREALALVHLDHLADRYPRQLSGGQQQRVAFARATVFQPPLLLMDEPLGALDRQLRKEVQSELKRIQKRLGLTVIYVTHDHDEALFLSDRIAIMEGGRIAQAGAPPELYARPGSRFVAEFLGESNFVAATLVSLDGAEATARLPDGTLVSGSPVGLSGGPGRPVDVLVRPEKLDVLDPVPASPPRNRIAGIVEMVNFLGGQQEVEVRTCGGMLAARSYLRANLAPPPPGTPVTLGFASEDCLMFPGDSGRAP